MNHGSHFSRQNGDYDQKLENATMPGTRYIAIEMSAIIKKVFKGKNTSYICLLKSISWSPTLSFDE
ncbi:hypothetical protein E4T38_00955 [Aureobasidium subglaciale]|nr:hypothetical protein E4T38_00955 [Aureobasidium subglaciale]KAI5230712.1 hypothetical protein E4T40_00956 [Aureobasidium subglaciale]KAI5233944.1 hypothetical protein E4T41_00954 [Aureobasidium subglaciale]KAI5267372.1 hypothetical protein E4T46_00954 [Aureobasidium subglaciale]